MSEPNRTVQVLPDCPCDYCIASRRAAAEGITMAAALSLDEWKARVQEWRQDLEALLCEKLRDFQNQTGLRVAAIDVQQTDVTAHGMPKWLPRVVVRVEL